MWDRTPLLLNEDIRISFIVVRRTRVMQETLSVRTIEVWVIFIITVLFVDV